MAGATGEWRPHNLVFVDETGASTKMTSLYGRCPRGQRLVAPVPCGHWKTTTFVGALRQDGLIAPCALIGPSNVREEALGKGLAFGWPSFAKVLRPGVFASFQPSKSLIALSLKATNSGWPRMAGLTSAIGVLSWK